MDNHIELHKVTRSFRKGGETIRALDRVDLTVARGDWCVVAGVSGSGKTTLLNLIGGLDRATEGEVLVNGCNLGELDSDALAEYRRTQIGFVFQSFSLIPTFTALENVCLPFIPYGVPRKEAERKAWEMLEQVGMAARADHLPGEMSGGEQQRVAIARALVNDPSLLLADEPTGDLDVRTADKVMELLRDLHQKRGMTVVMTSHDPRLAEQAPTLVRLEDGRIVQSATKREDG